MAESTGSTSRRPSRANWVALRTLHQVPRVVGETASGDTIFEVRSVRLVLGDEASHFSRLVTCSRCGREVLGSPVRSVSDLDVQPHPVICRECVKLASRPMYARPNGQPTVLPVDPPAAAPDDERLERLEERIQEVTTLVEGRAEPAAAVDADRLGALEQRMDGILARLAELTEGAQGDAGRARVDARLDELRGLVQEQAGVEGRVIELDRRADQAAQVIASTDLRLSALEDVSRSAQAERSRVDALAQRVDEVGRVQAGRLEQTNAERARVEGQVSELDRRVERAAQVAASADLRLSALEDASRSAQVDRGRVEVLEQRVDQVVRVQAERFEQASVEVARVEEQVNERLERRAERAERAAREAEAGGRRLAAVEDQVADAVRSLGERLHALRRDLTAELEKGLAAVRATVTATGDESARRLRAVELRIGEREQELADLGELQASLDTGLGELRSAIEALRRDSATLARNQGELDERLAALAESTPAAQVPARGRIRGGAKGDLAAVAAQADGLARQYQALQARLAGVEHAVARAADAATAASSSSSTVAPLRSHVRVLDDELSAQHDAIEALRAAVEGLLRKPKPAAAAKKAPAKRSTKG